MSDCFDVDCPRIFHFIKAVYGWEHEFSFGKVDHNEDGKTFEGPSCIDLGNEPPSEEPSFEHDDDDDTCSWEDMREDDEVTSSWEDVFRLEGLNASRKTRSKIVGAEHGRLGVFHVASSWQWGNGVRGKRKGRGGCAGRVEPVQILDKGRHCLTLWSEARETGKHSNPKASNRMKKEKPSLAEKLELTTKPTQHDEEQTLDGTTPHMEEDSIKESHKVVCVVSHRILRRVAEVVEAKQEQRQRNRTNRWRLIPDAPPRARPAATRVLDRDMARAAAALGLDVESYRVMQELQFKDDRALVSHYDLLLQVHQTANQRKTVATRHVATLPSQPFSGPAGGECAVCLCALEAGQDSCRLPCSAGHVFHARCIRQWLSRGGACCPLDQEDVSAALTERTRVQASVKPLSALTDDQQLQLAIQQSLSTSTAACSLFSDPIRAEQEAAYAASLRADEEQSRREAEEREAAAADARRAGAEAAAAQRRQDTLRARAAALPAEPEAGAEAVTVRLRLPTGSTVTRRCEREWKCQVLFDLAAAAGVDADGVRIVADFPRREVVATETLEGAGLRADAVVSVESL